MGKRIKTGIILLGVLAGFVAGCGDQRQDHRQATYQPEYSDSPPAREPLYIFSVHPLHNPAHLHAVFGPLMEYLSEHIDGANFRLEASRNYAAYNEKLFAGAHHFSLPNPYQTIEATKHGYRVFGKMGDDHNFRGIILVRKDSGIHEVSQLKGKTLSFPAPTALAATMMPQHYLHTHGLDLKRDVSIRYVGSQESSILNVYHGHVAAAGTWPPPWYAMLKERPELAGSVEVAWRTEPLPNNGLVVRNDVPDALVTEVSAQLFSLHTHEEGRAILKRMELSRFEAANDETYQPVRDFLKRFNSQVRRIE